MGLATRGESVISTYVFMLGTWLQGGQKAMAFYKQGVVFPHNFWSRDFAWNINTWYHLKLTADGDRFRFYVDDELALEYQDSTYAAGKVGISGAYTETTIHFDDVVITGDDVPDINLSAERKGKSTATWGAIKY